MQKELLERIEQVLRDKVRPAMGEHQGGIEVVDMKDGVAAITVYVIPYYGCKVMSVCKKVQENVKQTIQIMTGITVTRVNVVAAGLAEAKVANAE